MKKPNNPQFDIHPAIISALQALRAMPGKASASPGVARRTTNTAIAATIMPIRRIACRFR